MEYTKIPTSFKVGGQEIEVRTVERCDDDCLGICDVPCGYIEIANTIRKDGKQSLGSKVNTFYHELTHSILRTMGEMDLNNNEKFVCGFSSLLTEAMAKAVFMEE